MNKKNRTFKTLTNISYGFISKLLSMLLSFISRAIFVRVLTVEYLGIQGLFSDVLMLLTMADLGFGVAMGYSFYEPLANNDYKKLSSLVGFYKKVYNIIAAAVLVLGLSFLPFINYVVVVEKPIPYLHVYYVLILLNTVASYLLIYKSNIIIADQKKYIVSKYDMGFNLIKIVIQIGILYFTGSYGAFLMISIMTTLGKNIATSAVADKMYPIDRTPYKLDKDDSSKILSNMKSVFLYKLSSVLLTGTDNLLISIMVGTVAVGSYANYKLITMNLMSLVGILFNSITPSIGNLIVSESYEKRYRVFGIMQMASFWIATTFTVAIYLLTDDFISLWLNESYVLNRQILIAIVFNFYLAVTLHPIWSFREATGLYVKTRYVMVATAIVNLVCSVIFGLYYGVAGIVFASFIAKIVTYFWYEPLVLFGDFFNRRARVYFIKHIQNVCILMLCLMVSSYLFDGIKVDGYFKWLIKGVAITVITTVIYVIINIRSEAFRTIRERMVHIVKSK